MLRLAKGLVGAAMPALAIKLRTTNASLTTLGQTVRFGKDDNEMREFDVVVIGGGTGGVVCASDAADAGLKVAVVNYVEASPHGTTWGIGGTCLHVGCVPKYLFHQAARMIEYKTDGEKLGLTWKFEKDADGKESKHIWETLIKNVQNYIIEKGTKLRMSLGDKNVTIYNRLGKFNTNGTLDLILGNTFEFDRKIKGK